MVNRPVLEGKPHEPAESLCNCDPSGHIQTGKPARHKTPEKMAKHGHSLEKWIPNWDFGHFLAFFPYRWLFFGHVWPGAIFHFLSHFFGIFVSGWFPIMYTILFKIITRIRLLFSNLLGRYSYIFWARQELISVTVTVLWV